MNTNFIKSYFLFVQKNIGCETNFLVLIINFLFKQSLYYNINYIILITAYSYFILDKDLNFTLSTKPKREKGKSEILTLFLEGILYQSLTLLTLYIIIFNIYNIEYRILNIKSQGVKVSVKEIQFKLVKNINTSISIYNKIYYINNSFTKSLVNKLKIVYKIIFNIITKYKYILLFMNVNYIFCIFIDWLIDSNLSSYLLSKFSNIVSLQIINTIISKLNLLVIYLYSLENTLHTNITIYNITNIKSIILFIVINLTFLLLLILYIFYIINIVPLFESHFFRILLKQLNLLKGIHKICIFICNLLYLDFSVYYFSFNFINFIFINTINLSLPNKVLVFFDQNWKSKVEMFSSLSTTHKLCSSNLVLEDEGGAVNSEIDLVSNLSNSPTASENLLLPTEEIIFNNFKELNKEDKSSYLINKYENKGMTPTFYTISWLSDKIQINTDGNKLNVDLFIDNYLNQILNLERDTQLKSFAFHRDKPFLRHLIYKTPLEYPYVIPANNNMSEFEMFDLKDALIKNEEETINKN